MSSVDSQRTPSPPGSVARELPPAVRESDIVASRGERNAVDPRVPYAFLVEPEHSAAGTIDDVATIFLTNRECPFRCLYCDLWKNTTIDRVPVGAIPGQIEYALARLGPARHVKLYNSGNFFDAQAIAPDDHAAIAGRVAGFETVVVENHPNLCGAVCVRFRDRLRDARGAAGQGATLEVALGLETVAPEILPRLNKRMTLDDFRRAAGFLVQNEIAVRAFILLKPPYMEEPACIDWALRSLEFAFDCGARVCTVIPTRGGNGVMEQLAAEGWFDPPRLASLEAVLDAGLAMGRGRVFVDLWDSEPGRECQRCGPQRLSRLQEMNLSQRRLPPIACNCT